MPRTSRFHPRVIFSRLKTRVPFFIWLLAIAAVAGLALLGGKGSMLPGQVERKGLVVGSTMDGVLKDLSVVPGQSVAAGEVIATIDVAHLRDQQLKAAYDLSVQSMMIKRDYTKTAYDAATKRDAHELKLRETKAEIDAIEEQIQLLQPLVDQGLLEPQATVNLRAQREAKVNTLDLFPKTIQTLDAQINWANKEKSDLVEAMMAPAEFCGDTNIVNQLELLERRIKNADIIMPAAGVVSTVNVPDGQYVEAGQPVVSIVITNNSRIVAFLNQNSTLSPQIGEVWLVRSVNSAIDKRYYRAEVVSLAPEIVEIPISGGILPMQNPRGRYIHFNLLEDAPLIPGQAVNLVTKKPLWESVSRWVDEKLEKSGFRESIAILR